MATTPNGYPYPVGTDLVNTGDDTLHALADAADTKGSITASGFGSFPAPSGLNTPVTLAVVLPAGRFTATPGVTITGVGNNPERSSMSAIPNTTNGFLAYLSRNQGLTSTDFYWQAIQD